ncbi:MAG: chromate transporter [Clostridiales bacterium]|nr:chromate transporter [Clostridiales bacterium]
MEENEQNYSYIRKLLTIFLATLKIGFFTFGGGLAMIPMIQNEFADKRRWICEEDISDIIAVAQTLPGMVAVNVSVLAGFRIGGTVAAVVAAFGCILPSFAVLCVIALVYSAFIENQYVRGALRGISGAVIALFVSALVKLFKRNIADVWSIALFIAATAIIIIFPGLNVFFIIIGGGFIGFVLYFLILGRARGIRK